MNKITSFAPYKVLSHLDKLKNPGMYPITFTIDPTNICNEDCDFCLNGLQRKASAKEMPLHKIKDILDLAKQLNIKGIKIAGGGEPLAYSDIKGLLGLLKEYDFDYGLTTNGTLMTEDIFEGLQIFKYINVSLETFNPKLYKHIRKADLAKVLKENIQKYNKIRTNTLSISCLVHEQAYTFLANTVKTAKEIGCDSVVLKSITSTKNTKYSYIINQEVLYYQIQKSMEYNSKDFKVLDKTFSEFKYSYDKCKAVYLGGVWGADGKFHICCDRRNDGLYLFDFYKNNVKDFTEYWDKEQHRTLVDSINPITDCPRCTFDSYNKIMHCLENNDIFENLI